MCIDDIIKDLLLINIFYKIESNNWSFYPQKAPSLVIMDKLQTDSLVQVIY